jgi:hypothetical protein
MKTLNFPTSACRYCRYYRLEGRRGGECQQLGVPVRGNWKACSLASPLFGPSWESIEGVWSDEKLMIKEAFSVSCSMDGSRPHLSAAEDPVNSETLTPDIVLV